MKTILFIALLCTSSLFLTASNITVNLYEAIQKKMVKVGINGRGYTSAEHTSNTGKCIKINIKNLTQNSLNLKLETGRKLHCIYDSIQDMMVARRELFALSPMEEEEYTIYAFCTQKRDQSPSISSKFTLEGLSEGYLYDLSLLIEDLKAFDNTGQQAVWVLTDKEKSKSIRGSNEQTVNKLKMFVEYAIANPDYKRNNSYIYDYSYPDKNENGYELKGEINWDMPYTGLVSLILYDNNNQKVKVLFDEYLFRSGFQTYDYKLQSPLMKKDELYWLRVEGFGTKIKEIAIKID